MIHIVSLAKRAMRQLEKMPHGIVDKLESWVQAVEIDGLEMVREEVTKHEY